VPNYICTTCGIQYPASSQPPSHCPICEDDRQYVNYSGQQWTTLDELQLTHRGVVEDEEPGLIGIGMEPSFAIGQRALLVETPGNNVLWDCIPLLDDLLLSLVRAEGGISAIAVSHPHFYASMIEWSHALGRVPVYVHAADRQWVMRPDPVVRFWEGETLTLGDGLTLIHCGGHFDGSTVLHWAYGAQGRGALLSSDTLQVVSDRRYVSFMYSYPNFIPLPAFAVRRIVEAVEPFAFERIYGGWWQREILEEAKSAVAHSADRYLRAISAESLAAQPTAID
jgi:glyoxylase-like metal-dependent hydrolase (beta-lactamase superfamily II)